MGALQRTSAQEVANTLGNDLQTRVVTVTKAARHSCECRAVCKHRELCRLDGDC